MAAPPGINFYKERPSHNREQAETVSNRIYVGRLCNETDDKELFHFFQQIGPVLFARIIVDEGGFSKGYGFVTFRFAESAKQLLENPIKENIWLRGRRLYIGAARQKAVRGPENNNTAKEDCPKRGQGQDLRSENKITKECMQT